ncbi:MAG: hypothetical protein ABSC19_16100 [Syntrophorhabdales bacterium]|jgi:hypothetical protein
MADYTYEEKEDFEGKKVKVLGPTYEPGKPVGRADWTEKLEGPEVRLGYLKTALRYWYSKDWFGSEKRKQEA